MYKILSMDGGGIYGIITVRILNRIQKQYPGLLSEVDLFTGTSVGGIIALGMADNCSLDELEQFFLQDGPVIFEKDWFRWFFWLLGWKAKYSNKNLTVVLQQVLANKTLADLPRKVMVPSFLLDYRTCAKPLGYFVGTPNWRVKFFHNLGVGCGKNILAYKVGLYTSAAPTYFPVVDGMIDGCLACNNPALSAICLTQDEEISIPYRPSIDEISILSIGMNQVEDYARGQDLGWMQWGLPLLHVFLDNDNAVTAYQCDRILGDRHIRIEPLIPPSLDKGMDAGYNAQALADFADTVDIISYVKVLEKQWT